MTNLLNSVFHHKAEENNSLNLSPRQQHPEVKNSMFSLEKPKLTDEEKKARGDYKNSKFGAKSNKLKHLINFVF